MIPTDADLGFLSGGGPSPESIKLPVWSRFQAKPQDTGHFTHWHFQLKKACFETRALSHALRLLMHQEMFQNSEKAVNGGRWGVHTMYQCALDNPTTHNGQENFKHLFKEWCLFKRSKIGKNLLFIWMDLYWMRWVFVWCDKIRKERTEVNKTEHNVLEPRRWWCDSADALRCQGQMTDGIITQQMSEVVHCTQHKALRW